MIVDKYTLRRDRQPEKWRLEKEGADRAKRTFDTKDEALRTFARQWASLTVPCGFGSSTILFKRNGRIRGAKTLSVVECVNVKGQHSPEEDGFLPRLLWCHERTGSDYPSHFSRPRSR